MNFYYLHLWSAGTVDNETVFNRTEHPPIVENLGIELNSWPADDLFDCFPVHIMFERLRFLTQYWGYSGVDFCEISRMSMGYDFVENYPKAQLSRAWWLRINGEPLVNDLALWDKKYLVVSEKLLHFLRDNHVNHAESDLIDIPLETYFNTDRHLFWMKI